MRKILLLSFIISLFYSNTYSEKFNAMRGIKEFSLFILLDKETDNCGVAKDKIENSILYITSNSKIKFNIESDVYFTLRNTIISDDFACYAHVEINVYEWRETVNFAKENIVAPLLLYQKSFSKVGSPNKFARGYLNLIEDMTKKFVVDWAKVNQ